MTKENGTKKERQWSGYYSYYLSQAKQKEISSVEVLDQQWNSGEKRAQISVLPWISNESVVLEIASGLGRVSRHIAPACKVLYCTDIIPEALNELRQNVKAHPNVIVQQINGYDLNGFGADFFDAVFSFTAFFHFDFEIVVQYFAEIKRVLKPGGVCVLEFKKMIKIDDVKQLLTKIGRQGGIAEYEGQLDKWRYVSKEMLAVLCEYFELTVLNDDVTNYTFRK